MTGFLLGAAMGNYPRFTPECLPLALGAGVDNQLADGRP
jgi:hypothetical protein